MSYHYSTLLVLLVICIILNASPCIIAPLLCLTIVSMYYFLKQSRCVSGGQKDDLIQVKLSQNNTVKEAIFKCKVSDMSNIECSTDYPLLYTQEDITYLLSYIPVVGPIGYFIKKLILFGEDLTDQIMNVPLGTTSNNIELITKCKDLPLLDRLSNFFSGQHEKNNC